MSDIARVRAEIKSWERDFASTHGRDPAVQDIRDQPAIADKYKLYKKLSKAPTNQTLPPSTPPRSNARLPVPKSRAVDAIPSLPGFNPFSPVKKSAKHLSPRPSTSYASRASAHANPFATPAKNKSKSHPRAATSPPDPILPVSPTLPNPDASSSHALPVSTTAVSRARKRLRGEPVSPSPNKPKRQRIRPQALPPVLKSDKDSSESEPEVDQELPQCDFASSFVADSPVKAPAGGKSFKLLFDDALPALSIAKKPVGSSTAQLHSPPNAGLPRRTSIDPSVPTSLGLHCDSKSKGIASGPEDRLARPRGKMVFPPKDHLSASSHSLSLKTMTPQPRTSTKRALDSGDSPFDNAEFNTPLQSRYSLIPPSPPPQDAINRDTGKGKAKTTAGRKRLRIEDDRSDDGADSKDEFTFKVATVTLNRANHSCRHSDDLDCDLLLHPGTRNHDEAANGPFDVDHHAPGTFTVELPDKFRRVLAISPSGRQNNSEEHVVRGLLYGHRVGHYDPSRGGDIWDAGEADDGTLGDAENEDDWEGEPVPWEVGEL